MQPINSHFLLDTDECATANGGCEDRCENIPGSYNCHCDSASYEGYRLADDGLACDGKSSSNNTPSSDSLTIMIGWFITCKKHIYM